MGKIIFATIFFLASITSNQVFAEKAVDGSPGSSQAGVGLSKELFGGKSSDEPININSNSLTLKSDQRIFLYTGNVKVVQADMTLTSDELQGKYDENNQIQELVARKNVLIVKGDKIRASSQKAVYTASNEVVTLTENPRLEQEGSTLMADVIKVLLRDNKSVAEGNVQVTVVKKTDPTPGPVASAAPSTNTSSQASGK